MNFILGIIALIILVTSLVLTMRAGKLAETRQSEFDSTINGKVQERPYVRNPIFLAYIIGIGVVLVYLFYIGITYY